MPARYSQFSLCNERQAGWNEHEADVRQSLFAQDLLKRQDRFEPGVDHHLGTGKGFAPEAGHDAL